MVTRLYDIANDNSSRCQKQAQNKLRKWGLNFTRRCCLPKVCRNLLVRLPGKDEVFPCLDWRDTLHGIMMFIHRQLIEAMDYIPFSAQQRRMLDRRLAHLGQNRYFRDPLDQTYRTQKTMFGEVGMTAHDRVQLIFYLPHVFGHQDHTCLPDPALFLPLLTAVARAQLIIIAVRGLRCYTEPELRDIFDRGYITFFGALQSVRNISYRIRLARHEQQPHQYKKPTEPFQRPPKFSDESDTTDTDNDCDLGGDYYSHGLLSLVHQHWVKQVITAGGFNVNCTQSAEAAHKISAKLAASRSRHLGHGMKTLTNMITYLCNYTVFEFLRYQFPEPRGLAACPITYGVKLPLIDDVTRAETVMGTGSFTSRQFQSSLLHKEVLLTRVEIMDMLCDQFQLPKDLSTYAKFETLGYKFGQKFTTASGVHLWATDSRYTYESSNKRKVRRDRFLIKGVHKQTYRLGDGRRVERLNALCAEATCFLTVSNLSQMTIPALDPERFPGRAEEDLRTAVKNDSITFFLVRWFEPHILSHERDLLGRPICPGPLHINHCLWTYAKTSEPRRSLPPSTRSWSASQKRAYYGLIFPDNVLNRVNMTPCFISGSEDTGDDWLETVTLI